MAISRKEVEKVSLLGRLLLSEEELDKMTVQLGQILDYMDLLSEVDTEQVDTEQVDTEQVDTEQVEPMAHALDVADVFRADAVQPSLDRERALANAPNRDEQCYLVPAVLGEL